MSKEKELAELEKALQRRRMMKSRDGGFRSTRKNFHRDLKDEEESSARAEEKRIAEEFQ